MGKALVEPVGTAFDKMFTMRSTSAIHFEAMEETELVDHIDSRPTFLYIGWLGTLLPWAMAHRPWQIMNMANMPQFISYISH